MKLSLLDDARTDAFHAIDSFNELAIGLGEEFEDELFACFDRIKKNPEHYAENENGFRMARLKRFQAVVSFKLHLEIIFVVRVLVNGREKPISDR